MTESTPRGQARPLPQDGAAWAPPSDQSAAAPPAWSGSAPGAALDAGPTPPPPPASPRPGVVGAAPTFRSWQPGIIALRPLTFGDFLSAPFRAMRFNRAVVLGGPLLFTLIAGLISVTATWLVFTDPQLGLTNQTPSLTGINVQTVVMIALSLVVLLLADVLSSSIVAPGVARAVLGERIGLAVAWRQMRQRIGSLMVLYLASTAVYITLLIIASLPFVLGIAAGDDSGGTFLLSVLLALALLLPAGLLVTLLQGVARSMVVLEGIGAPTAIRRSLRLIKGRFWWSVLIVFVTASLINVVSSVLQQAGQIGSIAAIFLAPENVLVLGITYFVGYGLTFLVAMVLTYSYMGSVFTLMYTDLRMRREGFDLDLAQAAEARAARQTGR